MNLLWTNPNPTNEMAGQTLGIYDSDYRFLIIVVRTRTDNATLYTGFIVKGQTSAIMTGEGLLRRRNFGFGSDGSLAVGTGQSGSSYGNMTNDNSAVIPIYIYGIK